MKPVKETMLTLLFLFIFLPTSNEVRLLFANRRDIRLMEINTNGSSPRASTTITTVVDKLSDVTSLDWVGSTICWTDLEDGAIYCETDSKRRTIVNNHLPSPEDMSIDWLTNKIYWTDSDNNRIEVVSMELPYHRAVIIQEDMDQPRAIVVSPQTGLLFWTDWGEYPRIERATMSGSERRTLVTTDLFWPNGIALDMEKKILFWVDAKLHTISFVDFEGRNRGRLGRETTGHPFALIFASGGFYWSDWHTNSLHYLRNTIPPPRPVPLAPRYPLTPMDLVDYTPRPNIPSPCARASCSHLCLLSPGNFTCACPTGIGRINQTHCKNQMEEFLLVARSTEMRLISLDTQDYTDMVLPLKGLRHVLAVDWEDTEGWVYWTDDEKRVIERARLNGSEQKPVITTQIVHPDGLAIDPIASNLYWTDAGTDRIEISKLDGSFRRVVVSKHLQEPRAIAVDPLAGWLFWSDWGKQPKIEKSRLDGSERLSLISEGISWPNGIALDPNSQLMYWCDGKLDKIEVSTYAGTQRHVLTSSNLPHTFGFTILNNDLYWTDWQRRVIEKADKDTGRNRVTIKDPFSDANGLKAVRRWRWRGVTNGCTGNGGCGELCFWMGDSVKCGCRSGYELKWDNRSCFLPGSFLIYTGVGDLHRVSLNRSEEEEVIPVSRLKAPVAVASWGDWVYWTDSKTRSLSRAKVDGTGGTQTIIDLGLFHPEGVAIDQVAGNIYWTDMRSGKVEVCTLEGKYRLTVVWGVEEPRSIVVDQNNRYLYFSLWATTTAPGITRSETDGTGMTQFVTNWRTHGLAIDGDHLYFTNIDSETVLRKPFNGGSLEFLFKALAPYSLVVHGDRIYFSSLSNGSIYHIPKEPVLGPPNPPIPLLTFAGDVLDMTVYTYNETGPHNCHCDVGLCIIRRTHTSCLCGNHQILSNGTCQGPNEFLLAGTSSAILRILNQPAPDDVVSNIKNARSVDWRNGLIYSDGGRVKGLEPGIEGWEVALDRSRDWVFFTTTDGGVNVSTTLGVSGVVVPGSEMPPQHLVPHPSSSTLFYVQGEVLYRIRYDGKFRRKVVDGSVNGFGISGEFLYFSLGQVIWRSALDGSGRLLVVSCGEEVRAIALWGDVIFYSTQTGLFKVPTSFSSTITPVLPVPVTTMKFVNLSTPTPDICHGSPCSFCVEGTCSCPTPLVLALNGRHCVVKLMCGAGEWECDSGPVGCIGNMKRCDGVIDCRDEGSDEANCATDPPACINDNCGELSKFESSTAAPWGILIACLLTVTVICIIGFICHRRHLRKRPRLPVTTTTEPLFHNNPTPPSHPSSSPYCELLAPHPSPATDCCREYCGNPPPTPCSTDVCSDIVYSPPPPSSAGGTSSSGGRSRGVSSSINMKRSNGWGKGERYNNYVPPPPSPT